MRVTPKLYWIDGPWPGRLAVAARPRGGEWLEDEMAAWRDAGVDVVASLLTSDEAEDLGLSGEPSSAATQSLRYVPLPIPDRDIPPSQAAAVEAARGLAEELERGSNVLIHCRQGIGRSASIAALVLAAAGVGAVEAFRRIGAARGLTVPETQAQREWVERVAPLVPLAARLP